MPRSTLCFLLLPFVLLSSDAKALELHPLFSDHAVLQQEMPVPVWGVAEKGASVVVRFGEQTGEARTDEEGRWMVVLDPLRSSSEGKEMVVTSGDETVRIENVLVGEVWVGSGQSNMAMSVSRSLDAEATAKAAGEGAFEGVRLFRVPVEGSDTRTETVEASWTLPTPELVGRFSATAFNFAAKLAKDRSVPVGIIQSANGGTNAFSWINSDTFQNEPVAETVREQWIATLRAHPAAMDRYTKALAEWREKAAAARKAGEKLAERAPREPLGPEHVKRPTGHYNAMIAPLQPFAIRGVIWYQGEANSRLPYYPGYRDLMLALVEDWRADWATASGGAIERVDFPFYLVQLPNFANGDPEGWPGIREQMLRFWQEGMNTGMVVTIDKGEADDIHPREKKPVGERLAQFARGNAYGENVVYSGPIFESLRIEGERAILTFQHGGGGLVSLDGEGLRHFAVAAEDGEFVPATATIDGDTVVVTSDEITDPRAVRYAWSNNPEGINFGNKEGLPASPFRTDSW